jgi:steroid 5-alpha reductase family enzyme
MSLATLAIVAVGVALTVCAIMALAWLVQQYNGNSGWVDVSWTFGTGSVAAVASALPLVGPWPHWRQLMVAALAAGWSLRLGLHIAARTRASTDDPRYRQLIAEWGDGAARQMFIFLQQQAAVGALLAVCIVLAAHNPEPGLRLQDVLGAAILLAALLGEAIADRQLRRFRANPANRHAVCDVGLWRWSRHPNYFFEWLAWLAYPLIAIDLAGSNPYGVIALLAPLCMYVVLVHISGIPPLEQHMLRTRGEAFRAYQRRTRPFFPIPLTST